MFTRTTSRTVHFNSPFTLPGVTGNYPPGDYRIYDDEEQITGISWLAYRRISTTMEVVGRQKTSRIDIDPLDLDAALHEDTLRTPVKTSLADHT
ncbi:hypothetical protein ACLE20_00040 [Rhizobium sp. YIM 134829]|uniref:hypothetical protein n=1 Tax=Rhizobium sp. YIM 134829 TaxID=3390453 RepID=UPI00397D48BB